MSHDIPTPPDSDQEELDDIVDFTHLSVTDSPSPSSPIPTTTTTTTETDELEFPPLSQEDVLSCQFSSWQKIFRRHVPKATVLKPLEDGFIEYLNSDGIFLPSESEEGEWSSDDEFNDRNTRIKELNPTTTTTTATTTTETEQLKWSDDEADENDFVMAFPELDQKIREVIDDYGSVMPKLNWSSPRDAAWISTTNTLKCVTPNDVYLLLKASNFITHDLLHAFDACSSSSSSSSPRPDFELVLKKWININPSLEFRIFVRSRRILAISQRSSAHFAFLSPIRAHLLSLITEFFNSAFLSPPATSEFSLQNFVFDVYIPKPDEQPAKVWLVDINPFSPTTDSLTFSWSELLSLDPSSSLPPELRLVSAEDGVHSFSTKPFSESMVPRDVVDASLTGGVGIAEFAKQWRDMLDKQADPDSIPDDDEGNEADDEM
ncbi:D123-domain-containing protein [Myxozyma melibiosi]|uniref:D123-domain-containing protein n=1 Tax=Myxozyma melibiosi TaxID=54550 RepID=A0ABR1F819_9ASCO